MGRAVKEWERGDFAPLAGEDGVDIPHRFVDSSGFSLVLGLVFAMLVSLLCQSLHHFDHLLVLGCAGGLTFVASIVAAYTGEANASTTSGFVFFGGVTALVGCLSAERVMEQWWFVHTGSVVHNVDVRLAIPDLEPHPAILHFKPTTYIDIAHAVDFHRATDYNLPSNSWPVCVAPLMFYHHVWNSTHANHTRKPLPVYDSNGNVVAASVAARAPLVWAYGERCCGKYHSADVLTAITCAGWHSKSVTTGVILKDKSKGVIAVKKTLDSLNLPLDREPILVMVTTDEYGVQRARAIEGIIKMTLWLTGFLLAGIGIIVVARRCTWIKVVVAPGNT